MHDLGDPITLSFVTSQDGSFTTPTAVTVTVTQPDGTTAQPTVTTGSLGHHRATFTAAQPGRHVFRWVATGPGARTHVDVFNVREATSQALVSIADVKVHLNMTGDADDEELRRTVEAATGVIERYRKETVARRTFTEEFHATSRSRFLVDHYPVLSVTSLARTDGSVTYDPVNLAVDRSAGIVTVVSGPTLFGHIRVTYAAGYPVVPPEFLEAAAIIAAHLFETQRMGTMGQQVNLAGENILTPSGMGYAIPHRAVELLGGRPPVLA